MDKTSEILFKLLQDCANKFIFVPSPEIEVLRSPKIVRTK